MGDHPGRRRGGAGGDPIGEDRGYGPARLLSAERVEAVAAELRELTAESLRTRFEPDALLEAAIYPQVWVGDDFADYLLPNFLRLRDFYLAAAEKDEAVLLLIT